MKRIILTWIVIAIALLSIGTAARAPLVDFDSCHDDLDRVRRAASDASDAAEEAQSKRRDIEDCTQDSESRQGCHSQQSDYQSAVGDLESDMDDLDSRLRSVQASCEYEFTINLMSSSDASQRKLKSSQRRLEASRQRLCVSLKGLMSLGATPQAALQVCKTNMAEELCKACLGLK
jgi:hypothetical protein